MCNAALHTNPGTALTPRCVAVTAHVQSTQPAPHRHQPPSCCAFPSPHTTRPQGAFSWPVTRHDLRVLVVHALPSTLPSLSYEQAVALWDRLHEAVVPLLQQGAQDTLGTHLRVGKKRGVMVCRT